MPFGLSSTLSGTHAERIREDQPTLARALGRLRLPVDLYPVAVGVEALERHHVRLVVVLDDLNPVA
jgi:hypothetical protein